ncbi:hypothetical protein AMECASPLE_037328 [Ameca splendens]|uniref:Uncharacterized protein n=1 Tax=Ameca splendens TaxID=208324 RepID=A0ABV0YJE2_9TELE
MNLTVVKSLETTCVVNWRYINKFNKTITNRTSEFCSHSFHSEIFHRDAHLVFPQRDFFLPNFWTLWKSDLIELKCRETLTVYLAEPRGLPAVEPAVPLPGPVEPQ